MNVQSIQADDLRDMARCIDEIMRLRTEYPQVFKPIDAVILDAATACVSISSNLSKDMRKYIFGDGKR